MPQVNINGTASSKECNNIRNKFEDKRHARNGRLPEKSFETRDSVLTIMFRNKDLGNVYYYVIVIFVCMVFNSVSYDLAKNRPVRLGLQLLRVSSRNFHLAGLIWITCFMCACSVPYFFNLWTRIRCKLLPRGAITKLWDIFWITNLISYYLLELSLIIKAIAILDIGSTLRFVLLVEATRFIMKSYAFIRTSLEDTIHYKPHSEKKVSHKQFSKYVYFLFAPTLIYRDEYPRTKTIRWGFVVQCFLEIITIILLISYVTELHFVENFAHFGRQAISWKDIAVATSTSTLPSLILVFLAFYIILHAWQNLFGELLTFGDRLFYEDWWTSTTYRRFYRTWNVLVQDWLYTYIYKDIYEYVASNNKWIARVTVMLVSAAVHELIICFTLDVFAPFLFIMFFGIGTLYLLIKGSSDHPVWHVLFLFSHTLGNSITLSLYAAEYFAQQNSVGMKNSTVSQMFLPKFITCDLMDHNLN